ncbi:MAG TPA: DUF1800 domain-containing protein [Flavisolibacter sp.]|jgi:uncharacterized protein (DUF1800 family)|nr:DUF1800 domain-containing protein [Flavisolibacter sp.]
MVPNQLKNQHLMWRAGFGPAADQLEQLQKITPDQLFKALQKASSKKPEYLDATDDYLKGLVRGIQEEGMRKKELDKDEKKNIQQQQRQAIKSLNLLWLENMVDSDQQLREKMAFFWHGHFASRNLNVFFQQQLLDVIRQNALGSFRDLLHEVSKSAAMLNFLNANQNRKDHPNENFAREVMELFTMGRGNYSENDIKEAARAFTGWGANIKGEFVFRKFTHDDGNKTVLGKTGNFDGDNVLDILLEQKQTSSYITQKIYRFFVNDNVDKQKVQWLADRFYKSDYDISKLMEDIFTSDWFYDEKNIGVRIKSPIELMAGIRRILPMKLENEDAQLLVQRVLGQVLFYPPNVAGWPGGKNWIDSSTLMMRMRLPQMFNDTDEFNVKPKADDDQMMGRTDDTKPNVFKGNKTMGKVGKPINAEISWNNYLKSFNSVPREQILLALNNSLLQIKPAYGSAVIDHYADAQNRESYLKTATIQIMSTPEYQMC